MPEERKNRAGTSMKKREKKHKETFENTGEQRYVN